MGWNSYMSSLSGASGLGSTADFLVSSGMRELGYTYVNTDEGWELDSRDAAGRLQPDSTAYPDGMKHFIDHLHNRGLKFGIYGAASGQVDCAARCAACFVLAIVGVLGNTGS